MDFSNLPDWMPFACMVTNRVVRKPMIARIIEGLMISAVGVVASLFFGLPVAMERVDAKIQANTAAIASHITWASAHVAKRDKEMDEARRAAERRDDKMMELMSSIDRCLRERTCTK